MTHYEALALMLLFGAVAILTVLQVIEHYERKEREARIRGLAAENRRLREESRIAAELEQQAFTALRGMGARPLDHG